MSIYLIIIVIPCLIWIIAFKFLCKIPIHMFLLQLIGLIIITGMSAGIFKIVEVATISDFEIRNGFVTKKQSEKVSCSHQYICGQRCSTDSDGNRHCVPKYCDEHAYDIDWDVKTTVGNFTIDRVDRRGTKEPPRWTKVNIDDYAANTFPTQNYLFSDSKRFTTDEKIKDKYKDKLLDYPRTFDYYNFNRIVGKYSSQFKDVNTYINDDLKLTGASKQLNVIIIITNEASDFFYAMREEWKGSRKNDVVVFYGVDKDMNIKWIKADAYADGEGNMSLIKKLELADKTKLTSDVIKSHYDIIKVDFHRMPTQQHEYLRKNMTPSILNVTINLILALMANILISYFIWKEL